MYMYAIAGLFRSEIWIVTQYVVYVVVNKYTDAIMHDQQDYL